MMHGKIKGSKEIFFKKKLCRVGDSVRKMCVLSMLCANGGMGSSVERRKVRLIKVSRFEQ
jgi:hypothetical protein